MIEAEVTLLDKTIGLFSPQRELNRVKARTHLNFLTGGGYTGASKKSRSLKWWKTAQGDSDTTDLPDLQTLRDRSFDAYRNIPLANGAIATAEINIVGTGLKLQSQVDSKTLGISQAEGENLSEKIEKEFALWAESKECDTSRTSNFYELQSIAFLSTLIGGDSIILLPSQKRDNTPYTLTIQLLESYKLSNKDDKPDNVLCAGGVETSNSGEPIKYHISKYHPFGLNTKKNIWASVDTFGKESQRRQVVHLFEKIRPGQRRGVPYLAPVIETLKQLGRYTDAELTAAVISGLFTVFIKSGMEENGDLGNNKVSEDLEYELGNGSMVELNPGESIDSANPGRPNQNFDPFTLSIIRQIGSSLQIPYELLIKHFTASYSASRGAMLEAFKFFRKKRKWLSQNFCQVVYEEWLNEAVLIGRIEAVGFFDDLAIRKAYCKATWNGDAPGQLDPVKETKAAKMRCEEGFSTRTQEAAQMNGTDFTTNIEKIKNERAKMVEAKLIKEEECNETNNG